MECAYSFDFSRLCHDRPYPREGELLGKTLDHNLDFHLVLVSVFFVMLKQCRLLFTVDGRD